MISGVGGFDVSVNRLIGIAAGKAARPGLRGESINAPGGIESSQPHDPQAKSELTDDERALIAELSWTRENGEVSKGSPVGTVSRSATDQVTAQQKSKSTEKPTEPSPNESDSTPSAGGLTEDAQLTEEEQAEVEKLKNRDAEVRRHEQAHKAAAGGHASGGPKFEYETGPDGKQYAVGGHVDVDTSPVSGDPRATIAKMQQLQRAALAPAEPSSKDRQVAAKAAQQEREARAELAKERQESQAAGGATGAVAAGSSVGRGAERVRAAFGGGGSSAGRFIDVAA